jgi:hypothetical protein
MVGQTVVFLIGFSLLVDLNCFRVLHDVAKSLFEAVVDYSDLCPSLETL